MIGITLSGADENTPIEPLLYLARFGAEIGLLYTYSPDGRNRYPSPEWITETVKALGGKAAIHICGMRARQQLYDCDYVVQAMVAHASRIQVNGPLDPTWVCRVCDRYPTHTIITQHFSRNLCLLPVDAPNHAILVDGSGARGISPGSWQRPATDKPVGFAGGLGPDNIREELPKIAAIANGHPNGWWVDMEGKLRDDDDWFSVDLAAEVMRDWTGFRDSLTESELAAQAGFDMK